MLCLEHTTINFNKRRIILVLPSSTHSFYTTVLNYYACGHLYYGALPNTMVFDNYVLFATCLRILGH